MAQTLLEKLDEALGVKEASDYADYATILIYGPPGVGKTVLAGTALDVTGMSPVLFIDIEGGNKANRRKKGARTVQVRSFEKLSSLYDDLESTGDELPYKTLVIDRLDELAALHRQTLTDMAHEQDGRKSRFLASQQHWNINQGFVRYIVRKFRDLPCNTIFIAHDKREKDDSTGTVDILPAFSGKLGSELPGFFDIVLCMQTFTNDDGDIKRSLLAQPNGKYYAKDRYGVLGSEIEHDDVNMTFIWDRIHSDSTDNGEVDTSDEVDAFASINKGESNAA